MAISINSKQNIGFTGLKQDIEQSRQIVAHVRKEYGRPHSNSYVRTKIIQHFNNERLRNTSNPRLQTLLQRLDFVRQKYNREIGQLRYQMDVWLDDWEAYNDIHGHIDTLKNLIKHYKAANCGEMANLVQYDHLKVGIKADNVKISIFDKQNRDALGDHDFTVRNLSKKAIISDPETWGQDAILIDAWTGSGIAARAQDTPIPTYKNGQKIRGEFIEGGISRILQFLKFNPDKEKIVFSSVNSNFAEEFMLNNRKNLK